jgi:hypothetical protein
VGGGGSGGWWRRGVAVVTQTILPEEELLPFRAAPPCLSLPGSLASGVISFRTSPMAGLERATTSPLIDIDWQINYHSRPLAAAERTIVPLYVEFNFSQLMLMLLLSRITFSLTLFRQAKCPLSAIVGLRGRLITNRHHFN